MNQNYNYASQPAGFVFGKIISNQTPDAAMFMMLCHSLSTKYQQPRFTLRNMQLDIDHTKQTFIQNVQ